MASKYTEIVGDIKTKMESITDIGQVHDWSRWNTDPKRFLLLFAYTPSGGSQQVRGWEVSRRSVTEHQKGAWFRHHTFKITGYMSLKDSDETEKVFQVLVDDLCEKFRAASGGTGWGYRNGDQPDRAPAQVTVIDERVFGDVLCHRAEILLSVTERIVI